MDEILMFDFVKCKYEGIYEIYPRKASNSITVEHVLAKLVKEGYTIYKIFDDWYRAMK